MKTFLIIILSIWLGGYLFFRYLLPWVLIRFAKKMLNKQFNNTEKTNTKTNTYTKKEGTINVDYIPKKENQNQKNNFDNSEYVDFEEI